MRVICERIVCSDVRRASVGLVRQQRLHQRGNRCQRIVHLMRHAGGEGSGRGQAFGLEQFVEHLAPLGHVMQDHLQELHLAERDQRRIDVEVTPAPPANRESGRSRRAAPSRHDFRICGISSGGPSSVSRRPTSGLSSWSGASRYIDSAAALAPARSRFRIDFVHRVGGVVDGVAVLLFGGAQRMLARLDIELRNHQPPLVDRGDHRVAHQLHPRPVTPARTRLRITCLSAI